MGVARSLTMPSVRKQFAETVDVLHTEAGSGADKSASLCKKSSVGGAFQNSNNAPRLPSLLIYGSKIGKNLCESAPTAYFTVAPSFFAAAVMPSSGDTVYVGSSVAEPPPDITACFALGPMTAILFVFGEIGRRPLPFLSRTVASAAALRRRARISGVSTEPSGPSNGIPESMAWFTSSRI